MSLLMQLIAVEIADKVARQVNVRNIFRRAPAEAMAIIRQGKDVLEAWFRTYLNVGASFKNTHTHTSASLKCVTTVCFFSFSSFKGSRKARGERLKGALGL